MMPSYMFSYFEFNANLTDFLFYGWSSHNGSGISGMCVAVLALVLLLEMLRTLNDYLALLAAADPLSLSTNVPVSSESSPLLRALMIPPSIEHVKKYRMRIHMVKSVVIPVQMSIGYFLMMAAMTYNAYVFLTLILGSGVVFFIFSHIRNVIKYRFRQKVKNFSEQNELIHQAMTSSSPGAAVYIILSDAPLTIQCM